MNFRDVELLSAYLDGQLSPSDSLRLESRLSSDPNLKKVLDDLRISRGLLHQLPQRRVPRNFTLSPKMAGLKAPVPRVYPTFRLATVLATLLLIFTFAINRFAPLATPQLSAAQVPAYGLGGGCENCGAPEAAPAATEVPLHPFSAISPTEISPSTQDNSRNVVTPSPPLAPKAAAPLQQNNQPTRIPNEEPIPLNWQVLIGVIAFVCGVTAWLIQYKSEQEFLKRWNKK
jgi:hypothetical protein